MTQAPQPLTVAPHGVYGAALTPLDADLKPDPRAAAAHCRWLLAHGCDGIGLLGTTGEANSFALAERLDLIAGVIGAGIPAERLIIGTGCCAIPDTVRLTEAAIEAGAAGVLVLPPFYYKGVDDDGLFAAFAAVIEAVGDSRLKLYLYNFPAMTGISLGLDLVVRLHQAYPDTVVGLKDSTGDWAAMKAMLDALPGFGLFSGTEQYLLACLEAGGAGTISATVNLTSAPCGEVYRAWREDPPTAQPLQYALTVARLLVQGYPLVPALKEIMARHTGEPGWRRLRPPLTPLPGETADKLWREFTASGFTLAAAA